MTNPLREFRTVGSVREEGPATPWPTYTGTQPETADTAKESLQLIGPPLLGGEGRKLVLSLAVYQNQFRFYRRRIIAPALAPSSRAVLLKAT